MSYHPFVVYYIVTGSLHSHLNQNPRFFTQSQRRAAEHIPILLEQRVKFTALFLADNARKLAVSPTVEICQLLMGLSIEMPFPEDLRKIDIVVPDCYTPNSRVSHIYIPISSQLRR